MPPNIFEQWIVIQKFKVQEVSLPRLFTWMYKQEGFERSFLISLQQSEISSQEEGFSHDFWLTVKGMEVL